MTRFAYKLLALTLGALVSLVLAEGVLRAMGMGFGNSPMEPDQFLHHVHPKSYKFIQQHPSGELGGFQIEYNADGRVYRGAGSPPPPANAECRIALMGDSFTEGGQVPFAETFAGLLEAASPHCEVRNYGVRSYSPAIYLVQWTRDIAPWKPTQVFVLLFGNDVREDVQYLATADVDKAGLPTAIHGPSDGWLFSTLRQFYVARFVRMITQRIDWAYTHHGEEQWTVGGVVEEHPDWGGPTPLIVTELNKRIADSGAHMTLMAVPSRYRLQGDGHVPANNDFHDTVRTFAQGAGIDFLELNAPFERAYKKTKAALFFLQDIHFTSAGHTVMAAAMARSQPSLFDLSKITGAEVDAAFGPDAPK